MRASYLEIYNETLKDLLAPQIAGLKIRQDERKRFFVSPLREEVVTCEAQIADLLKRGEENRSVGALLFLPLILRLFLTDLGYPYPGKTDFNERSSRSHSVFQMTIESRDDYPASRSATPSTPVSRAAMRAKTPNGPRLDNSNGVVRMSVLSLIDLAGSESAASDGERRSEGGFINKSCVH